MIIALQRLNYSLEYIIGASILILLLILRFILASKSKAAQAVKTVKKSVEKKSE